MPLTILPILLLNVLLNACGQISLKYGMNKFGAIDASLNNLGQLLLQAVTNPWLILGIFLYVLSMVAWLFVLSRVDISVAYPMVSLAYVVNAVGAYYLLGEHVTLLRMSGILVILLGVFLVAKS